MCACSLSAICQLIWVSMVMVAAKMAKNKFMIEWPMTLVSVFSSSIF